MLRIKRLSETIGKKVYTDSGDYFGEVEEVNLTDNKVDGWRLVVSRESPMADSLGGARGIIVPHQFVKSIGDVLIISSNAVPARRDEEDISVEEESM